MNHYLNFNLILTRAILITTMTLGIYLLPSSVQAAEPFEILDDSSHVPERSWDCKDGRCHVPTKKDCFNVYCYYHKKEHDSNENQFNRCKVASRFDKLVGFDGREILDNSCQQHKAEFEVECDDRVIFNNSAKRFTDEEGTRLQAEGGPFPATILPTRALRQGHRYTLSTLELEDGQVLHGYCFIYTGTP